MKTHKHAQIVVVALAVIAVHSGQTQGTLVFDQQSAISGRGSGGTSIQAAHPVGQSFTPASSFVGFVQLQFNDATQNNGTGSAVLVNLRENSITGNVLGTTATVNMPDNFLGTALFVFSSNIPVSPETKYFFEPVLFSGDDTAALSDFYNYTRGELYGFGQPSASGADLWFREGYLVPEPAATSLAVLGMLAIFVFRRKALG